MSPKKALSLALIASLALPLTSFAITISLSQSYKDTLIAKSKLKNATVATMHNLSDGSTYYQVSGTDTTSGEASVCNFTNIDDKGSCDVLNQKGTTDTPTGQTQTYNPQPKNRPSCQWYKDHGVTVTKTTDCSS
jgi:hypothetical protein